MRFLKPGADPLDLPRCVAGAFFGDVKQLLPIG